METPNTPQETLTPISPQQKSKLPVILITAVIVVIIVIVLMWNFGGSNKEEAQVTETPTPTSTTDNSMLYSDLQNGIEFLYSKNLVTESPSKLQGAIVALAFPDTLSKWNEECPTGNCEGSPYIFFVTTALNTNLDAYLKLQGQNPTRKQILLDGKVAYEEESGALPMFVVTVENSNTVYRLWFTSPNRSSLSQEEKQILSTFKFTNPATNTPVSKVSPAVFSPKPTNDPEIGKTCGGFGPPGSVYVCAEGYYCLVTADPRLADAPGVCVKK